MFMELSGVAKANSTSDTAMLEYCIREDLKMKAKRMMAVLDPIKLVIDNYPEGQSELLEVENNQENEALGTRQVSFSRELYIEREDFMEEPPKKYFRLFPGNEVRLKNAYFVKCTDFVKDENGNVVEVHCTYDPQTKSGLGFEGRKVKGTIHWVDAATAVNATVRLYENLIQEGDEVLAEDYSNLNPNSLVERRDCKLEAAFAGVAPGERFQFLRNGYFCTDSKDSTADALVFNRIVSLKSSYRPK
jgi:glutaminyl-tRNA synthetase